MRVKHDTHKLVKLIAKAVIIYLTITLFLYFFGPLLPIWLELILEWAHIIHSVYDAIHIIHAILSFFGLVE